MINNKKGFTQWIFVGVAVVIVLAFILLSRGTFSKPDITSLSNKASGYNKDKCDDIGVVISGNVNVEDSAFFDLEPSIRDVTVDEVLVNHKKLLTFGVEQFTYEVEAVDDITNTRLDVFSGSGELRSADNKGISKPYTLNFISKDMDCNNAIDDFNLKIKAVLKGSDIGQRAEYEKLIRFRQGRVAK